MRFTLRVQRNRNVIFMTCDEIYDMPCANFANLQVAVHFLHATLDYDMGPRGVGWGWVP